MISFEKIQVFCIVLIEDDKARWIIVLTVFLYILAMFRKSPTFTPPYFLTCTCVEILGQMNKNDIFYIHLKHTSKYYCIIYLLEDLIFCLSIRLLIDFIHRGFYLLVMTIFFVVYFNFLGIKIFTCIILRWITQLHFV